MEDMVPALDSSGGKVGRLFSIQCDKSFAGVILKLIWPHRSGYLTQLGSERFWEQEDLRKHDA